MILGLCDRFGRLPSEVRAEGTGLLRLIALERAVKEGPASG